MWIIGGVWIIRMAGMWIGEQMDRLNSGWVGVERIDCD